MMQKSFPISIPLYTCNMLLTLSKIYICCRKKIKSSINFTSRLTATIPYKINERKSP